MMTNIPRASTILPKTIRFAIKPDSFAAHFEIKAIGRMTATQKASIGNGIQFSEPGTHVVLS